MTQKPVETRIALAENNIDRMTADVEKLVKVVEENNKVITHSKGIAFGAALVTSTLWAAGLAIWKYISH